jgi:pilus assembly protein Flp/PilA
MANSGTGIYVVILMETTMKNLIAKTSRFIRDEDGITAIEYALLGSLIALAIVTAVTNLGTTLSGIFTRIGTSI